MEDRKILEYELARPIGRAVREWMAKNAVEGPVDVSVEARVPTLYIDETGVTHSGIVVTVDVCMSDGYDEEDGDDD